MSEPFLYGIVDKLYTSVMEHMPQALQDRSMASAFTLGSLGTYSAVRGLQLISKNAVDKIIPGFDDKLMPSLEKVCAIGMAAAPVIFAFADPDSAREIMTQDPTYTSGMAGVYVGSIAGAVQDLQKRSKSGLEGIMKNIWKQMKRK